MVEWNLIRHAEVAVPWKGICYGGMDVPLSPSGIEASRDLVANWPARPEHVVHSGLTRTRVLANMFVDRFPGLTMIEDDRLRERDYGSWEGKTWNEIFDSDPEHFHDLIEQPDTYRPPGGETTSEMQARITNWYFEHREQFHEGSMIAISHSGPIAALCGAILELPANQWSPWTIANLQRIRIQSGLEKTQPGFMIRYKVNGEAWIE
jgi:broad specificity phosphatase PhoE